MGLLVVTMLFAAGALFVKYKLESLRTIVQREAESRTGTRMNLGAVLVEGLRGLRIDDLSFVIESAAGPTVTVSVPNAYVYVDLADLIAGRISINRIQVDRAAIRIERPLEQPWIPEKGFQPPRTAWWFADSPFRVMGAGCTLEALNVVDSTRLDIGDFTFDVSRLPDAPAVDARLSGNLANAPEKRVQVDFRFTSLEDFDLRVQASKIAADDVNVFLPASRRFVESGTASPNVRLAAYPDNRRWAVSFQSPFENLAIRDQPEFFRPAAGALTVLASYDIDQHLLTVTTSKAESDQVNGAVEGSVSFSESLPRFDLRLAATGLPIARILDYALEGRVDEYGRLELALDDPHEIAMELRGTTEAPVISAHARAASGKLSFIPKDPQMPKGALRFGTIEAAWDSETRIPTGGVNITGGEITFDPAGISASGVSGFLSIKNKNVLVESLNAEITGNPFVGKFRYDFEKDEAELEASGTLAGIESTRLAAMIKGTEVGGSASIRGKVLKTGRDYTVDAAADLTQTSVSYQWWFRKAAGVGASGNVKAAYAPNSKATVRTDLTVASTPIQAQLEFSYIKPRMMLQSLKAASSKVDVVALGRCLALPYTVSGGIGTDGSYTWARVDNQIGHSRSEGACTIDDLALLADGSTIPSKFHNVRFEVAATQGAGAKASLTVHAKEAVMPPFGQSWFVPLLSDPDLLHKYPQTPRQWSYTLSADALEVPPWKGKSFKGNAVGTAAGFELRSFGADIEKGRLDGAYKTIKADNAYTTTVAWKDVPAAYFLAHLGLPKILEGNLAGDLAYSIDRDDPSDRKGKGKFEVNGGQFSADFVSKLLEGRPRGELEALPPSLKFSHLSTTLEFDKDVIRTPNLYLVSSGIELHGKGEFVTDGDMNYDIQVSITPETAEKIPVLKEYFNVQGHRISQQKIELAFRVNGPVFNPKGRVEQLPSPSVTLVSGALEVTREAIKVIEIPRNILMDLLRIGGGIMGPGPQPKTP